MAERLLATGTDDSDVCADTSWLLNDDSEGTARSDAVALPMATTMGESAETAWSAPEEEPYAVRAAVVAANVGPSYAQAEDRGQSALPVHGVEPSIWQYRMAGVQGAKAEQGSAVDPRTEHEMLRPRHFCVPLNTSSATKAATS